MDLKEVKYIHFIGIGGVHMSGLAHMLDKMGKTVTGSDAADSERMEGLRQENIQVFLGHHKDQLPLNAQWVIINAAVPSDNPELLEARKRKLEILDRPVLIGMVMKDYPQAIAVAGTHGKTTVTSMIATVLEKGKLDPTILNGGYLPLIGGYYKQGKGDYFVVEACEYKDSFISFAPTMGVILNIEMDHLDYFKDLNQLYDSFRAFALKIPRGGFLLIHDEILNPEKITHDLNCQIIYFGKKRDSTVCGKNLTLRNGKASFDLYDQKGYIGPVNLQVFGGYNMDNALAAATVWLTLGLRRAAIIGHLESFTTTRRRFEYKGSLGDLDIYDDFAHHPTEIKKTIEAGINMDKKPFTVLFEPHTAERTFSLYDDFLEAFHGVDQLLLLDIYVPPGRAESFSVSSEQLQKDLRDRGIQAIYLENNDAAKNYINKFLHKGILLTMGAGNVYKIGESLLKANGRNELSTLSTKLSTEE